MPTRVAAGAGREVEKGQGFSQEIVRTASGDGETAAVAATMGPRSGARVLD